MSEDVESCIHEIRPDGQIHGQFNPLGTDTLKLAIGAAFNLKQTWLFRVLVRMD
jgi:hypothetical protein